MSLICNKKTLILWALLGTGSGFCAPDQRAAPAAAPNYQTSHEAAAAVMGVSPYNPTSTASGAAAKTASARASVSPAAAAGATDDSLGSFLQERGLGALTQAGESLSQAGAALSQLGSRAGDLVVHAMGFIGVPYKFGGNSTEAGLDCSGFVRAVYSQSMGLLLPRKASEQAAVTSQIEKTELQPGDLVFFNTLKRAFSHVGIYVGNGRFVHAPRPGGEIRVESMATAYWATRFNGARRVEADAAR